MLGRKLSKILYDKIRREASYKIDLMYYGDQVIEINDEVVKKQTIAKYPLVERGRQISLEGENKDCDIVKVKATQISNES